MQKANSSIGFLHIFLATPPRNELADQLTNMIKGAIHAAR